MDTYNPIKHLIEHIADLVTVEICKWLIFIMSNILHTAKLVTIFSAIVSLGLTVLEIILIVDMLTPIIGKSPTIFRE